MHQRMQRLAVRLGLQTASRRRQLKLPQCQAHSTRYGSARAGTTREMHICICNLQVCRGYWQQRREGPPLTICCRDIFIAIHSCAE